MINDEAQGVSAVDQETEHNVLSFLRDLQKIGANQINIINHGTYEIWGVGRELSTVQKRI